MSDDDIIEIESEDSSHEDADFDRLWVELEARCKAASIRIERLEGFEGSKYVRIYFPAGRQTEAVSFFGLTRIQNLLSIQFEKYIFLGGYAAVCSYKDGVIETALNGPTVNSLLREITGIRPDLSEPSRPIPSLEIGNPAGPEKIFLGPGTIALEALTSASARMRPALRIEGLTVTRHDEALEILERIANSFFFQLDLLRDIPVTLRRRRILRVPSRRAPRALKELEFPKSDYDRDPISLYWYARSARGMPLLQFLAFYQTIEYYFPTYSQAEARRKIRNVLKSPAFRAEREADVARILLAARMSGSGFGDERSQLRATLNECLEPGALRAFLTESEEEKSSLLRELTNSLTKESKPRILTPTSEMPPRIEYMIFDVKSFTRRVAAVKAQSNCCYPFPKKPNCFTQILNSFSLLRERFWYPLVVHSV